MFSSFQNRLKQLGLDFVHVNRIPSGPHWGPLYACVSSAHTSNNGMMGILLGNTKLMWPIFIEHVHQHKAWEHKQNPLDEFIENQVQTALRDVPLISLGKAQVFYSHRRYPASSKNQEQSFVPFQRLADAMGMCALHEPSYLCIHPEYGPWFSLRALILVSLDDWPELADCVSPNVPRIIVSDEVTREIQQRMVQLTSGDKATWQDWVKLRRFLGHSIPSSSKWEYSQDQLIYHYTHDRSVLCNDSK